MEKPNRLAPLSASSANHQHSITPSPLAGLPLGTTEVAEAATVRHIFERYLELRSVHRLVEELKQQGIRSKARVNRKGETMGAQPFGRGAIFHLLKNRVYVGEIMQMTISSALVGVEVRHGVVLTLGDILGFSGTIGP